MYKGGLFRCFVIAGAALAPLDAWAQEGTHAPPPATDVAKLEAARAFAQEAIDLYKNERFEDAIDRFQKADALFPAQQYRVYIGRAYVRLGKVATAARFYEKAATMPIPTHAPSAFMEAQAVAAAELSELRRRIPSLQVAVTGPRTDSVQMTLDGVAVTPESLRNVELDPGAHVLGASAPGFEPATQPFELPEGATQRVGMVLRPISPPPLPATTPVFSPPVVRDQVTPLTAPVKAPSLSHRRQFGARARADIDPLHTGVVFAPGLTFGATDWLEVGASGLLGKDKGVELGATFFVLRGAWKPLVDVGVPLFFNEGARVGVRGAAGIQWDPIRHFGVFVQVGGAYFVNAQEGHARALFLPAAGVQARL